jgi:hypothetical protein
MEFAFACCKITIKTDHISGGVLSSLFSDLREALIANLLSFSPEGSAMMQECPPMMYFRSRKRTGCIDWFALILCDVSNMLHHSRQNSRRNADPNGPEL